MKKFLALFIVSVIIVLSFPFAASAKTPEFVDTATNVTSALLLDTNTGTVIYEKNSNERIYPASTTKLMTALLLLETKGLEGEIKVGPEVNVVAGSSLMYLKNGETISVKDIFYGLMVCSGNDAAAAIGVYVAGSVEAFVDMMNERAQQLGMTNTHFLNPHGIYEWAVDDPELGKQHYSTAADMSKLGLACMKYQEILDAASASSYTVGPTDVVSEPRVLDNSNYLLNIPPNKPAEYSQYLYDGATGLKTGLTQNILVDGVYYPYNGAIVATATRGDISLMACIFGDSSENALERWTLARDLFDYGFNNFTVVDISQYIQPYTQSQQLTNYASNDPKEGAVELIARMDGEMPGERMVSREVADGLANGTMTVGTSVTLTNPPVAPIYEGEEMGIVNYSVNGEVLYTSTLDAGRKVYQAGEEALSQLEYDTGAGSTGGGVLSSFEFQMWYLWVLIPLLAVLTLLLVRAINKTRVRNRRRKKASLMKQQRADSEFGQRSHVTRSSARPIRRR